MSVCLRISPPNILPWLSAEERRRTVVLFDFDADTECERTLRFTLNVIFRPISIPVGLVNQRDYYVGSTGADIFVETKDGSILQFTRGATLSVDYSNTTRRQRSSLVSLAPALKTKNGAKELEAKLGSITFGAEQEQVLAAKFSSEERALVAINLGDTIHWSVALPRGERIIRDFLLGNLNLYAVCRWPRDPMRGRISARPSDVRFFDPDRRPLGATQSIVMAFVLWRKGITVQNSDGMYVEFEAIRHD